MLSRVTPLLRNAAPRIQHVRRMGGHGTPAHWKPIRQVCEETKSHMNFMPVPEGSWQAAYNKKSAEGNKLLILSSLSCIITFCVLWNTNCIYLHTAPPMYNCKDK